MDDDVHPPPGHAAPDGEDHKTPRWVKALALVALGVVVIGLLVALMTGGHGPGRHGPGGVSSARVGQAPPIALGAT